jgi:hypothetical protein
MAKEEADPSPIRAGRVWAQDDGARRRGESEERSSLRSVGLTTKGDSNGDGNSEEKEPAGRRRYGPKAKANRRVVCYAGAHFAGRPLATERPWRPAAQAVTAQATAAAPGSG